MYRNVVPSAVTQRVVAAFRAELAPACEQIAAEGMPAVTTVAGLTTESVSRFLVGGFMEVLRSWMEDPDATDLRGRVTAALDTVGALLGLTAAAATLTDSTHSRRLSRGTTCFPETSRRPASATWCSR